MPHSKRQRVRDPGPGTPQPAETGSGIADRPEVETADAAPKSAPRGSTGTKGARKRNSKSGNASNTNKRS